MDFLNISHSKDKYDDIIDTSSKTSKAYSIFDNEFRHHDNPSLNQVFKSLSDIYNTDEHLIDMRGCLPVSREYSIKTSSSTDIKWGDEFEISIRPANRFVNDFYLNVHISDVKVPIIKLPDLKTHFGISNKINFVINKMNDVDKDKKTKTILKLSMTMEAIYNGLPVFAGADVSERVVYTDYSGMRMVESVEMLYANQKTTRTFKDGSALLGEWNEEKRKHFDREFCRGAFLDALLPSFSNYNSSMIKNIYGNDIENDNFKDAEKKFDKSGIMKTEIQTSEIRKLEIGPTTPRPLQLAGKISSPLSDILGIKRPIFLNDAEKGIALKIKLAKKSDMFYSHSGEIKLTFTIAVLVGIEKHDTKSDFCILVPKIIERLMMPANFVTQITGGNVTKIDLHCRESDFGDKIKMISGKTSVFECLPSSSTLFTTNEKAVQTLTLQKNLPTSLCRSVYFNSEPPKQLLNKTWWRHGDIKVIPIIDEKIEILPATAFGPVSEKSKPSEDNNSYEIDNNIIVNKLKRSTRSLSSNVELGRYESMINPTNPICHMTTRELKGYMILTLPVIKNIKPIINGRILSEINELGKWRFFDRQNNADDVMAGHIEKFNLGLDKRDPDGLMIKEGISNIKFKTTLNGTTGNVIDNIIFKESSVVENPLLKISTLPNKYKEKSFNAKDWTPPKMAPVSTTDPEYSNVSSGGRFYTPLQF